MTQSIKVMGILNVTPDSFFDGGKYNKLESATLQALQMEKQGASIIDVGGESTRPGAQEISADEELERVLPVIEHIRKNSDIAISVDTSKPEVMRQAVGAGATIINDVRALQAPNAMQTAAELQVPVCLMHMQGQPRSMQVAPHYDDVVREVRDFLIDRADKCLRAGITKQNIWLDPGFGFGKSLQHNLQLMQQLENFTALDYPVLVGVSRKSMLGKILDAEVEERLAGSLALATIAMMKGATVIRVHDVKETMDAVKVFQAMMQCETN